MFWNSVGCAQGFGVAKELENQEGNEQNKVLRLLHPCLLSCISWCRNRIMAAIHLFPLPSAIPQLPLLALPLTLPVPSFRPLLSSLPPAPHRPSHPKPSTSQGCSNLMSPPPPPPPLSFLGSELQPFKECLISDCGEVPAGQSLGSLDAEASAVSAPPPPPPPPSFPSCLLDC